MHDSHPLQIVLLDEFKEWLVAEHLGNLELMLVPTLCEAGLYVALTHVKCFPVSVRASLADKDAKCHIKVCTFVPTTLDTECIEGILYEQFLNELGLLLRLSLDGRFDLRRWNMDQVRIVGQQLVRLLLGIGHPCRLEPLGELALYRRLLGLDMRNRRTLVRSFRISNLH